MDISNLTYNELKNLENEIVKRKEELKRTEYECLVKYVLDIINEIIKEGYGDMIVFYGDEFPLDWKDLLHKISNEHEKGEDY